MTIKTVRSIRGLVRALGGTSEAAEWTGSRQTVDDWVSRNFIPPSWHFRLFIETQLSPGVEYSLKMGIENSVAGILA